MKWLGKCPSCGSWDSFQEELVADKKAAAKPKIAVNQVSSGVRALSEISQELKNQKELNSKIAFKAKELNDFWGNGLQTASLTLLAGEPGLGKSTLALQVLRDLINANPNLPTLYISAEESIPQLAERALRLKIPTSVQMLNANNLEQIIFEIQTFQKQTEISPVIILDSVQTVFSDVPTGSPGSVSQVTYIVNSLLSLAKSSNITILAIGHVTKAGEIAGPKTLEHMVDSVLLLEQPQTTGKYRTLYFSKHRFGSTEKMLLLEMKEQGLVIVKNPSLALIENLEQGIGICYSLALDKQMPLLIEVQALVHPTGMNFGRREASGISSTRLNIIVAILEKYLNTELKNSDIFVQVLGLPKGLYDDSLDLAILMALLSSLKNQPLEQFRGFTDNGAKPAEQPKIKTDTKARMLFSGRLTLSGSIRKPTNLPERQKATTNLGFDFNPVLGEINSVADLRKFI